MISFNKFNLGIKCLRTRVNWRGDFYTCMATCGSRLLKDGTFTLQLSGFHNLNILPIIKSKKTYERFTGVTMGGGNGQKAKMAREKNLEKTKASKGSQLDSNKKAMNIQVVIFYLIYIQF
ncbi:DNA polymerase III PolC-type [Striga asiatica]|uniref:DNA polymerase III PolC-type n=1 Tax=Striga asiatica TaxID=4170 RepID=A0A5A7PE85_STRAF|nr:DNA polymerase III PolC-type [Striga asiatica]